MNSEQFIRIYGIVISNIENSNQEKLIQLYAIGYGIENDNCHRVSPRNIKIKGTGKPAECNGSRLPNNIKVWLVDKNTQIFNQKGNTFKINEIIEKIDFIE